MADFDFDVNEFMSASYEQANSTQMLKLPDNWEGYGIVTALAMDKIVSKKTGETYVKLAVKLEFSGEDVSRHIKRDKLTDDADFLVDLIKDANGKTRFDMSEGKNIGLGQFRAAVGLNKVGVLFNPNQAIGKSVKVRHKLEADATDPSKVYSRYRFLSSL